MAPSNCDSSSGIGKELLKLYLAQPKTTVISAVRDVSHPSVQQLNSLPVADGSRHIIVKVDSKSLTDAKDAVQELQTRYGITKLDTVVANAGVGNYWGLTADTPISEVEEHFQVNSVGPFVLYLAVRSLLLASAKPRFVVLSTELGSMAMQKQRPIGDVAYGMSKAALNFFVAKVHHEEPSLIAFPIHPG